VQRGSIEDLPAVVAAMLTEPVTRWLPPHWHGAYTRGRAEAWIAEQDAEGTILLVEDRRTGEPLGLVLLFEEAFEDGVDVRLGYLLAENAWGRGYGGELLGGFVAWCRARGDVRTIVGGVAPENTASIRLLERYGFVLDGEPLPGQDLVYRLSLTH
jgi:RimJ/RimL family protein N-acetyltransferase